MKMKKTYVMLSKPLLFKRFELYSAPIGWVRIDILKKKLKENKDFRSKFTREEIQQINKHFIKTK